MNFPFITTFFPPKITKNLSLDPFNNFLHFNFLLLKLGCSCNGVGRILNLQLTLARSQPSKILISLTQYSLPFQPFPKISKSAFFFIVGTPWPLKLLWDQIFISYVSWCMWYAGSSTITSLFTWISPSFSAWLPCTISQWFTFVMTP